MRFPWITIFSNEKQRRGDGMDLGLKGLTALVTGASRGLGYATAHLLAQEGVKVAINGRNEAKLQAAAQRIHTETGGEVAALTGDVTLAGTPQALVDATQAAFGGLDLLVTNAGGPKPGLFEELSEEDWQRGMELCLIAHVRLIRAALPLLKLSAAPAVLTVTSVSVKQPIANLIISNSIRGATIGLTKSLALELAPQGIRFNSILPSWTETERITVLLGARAQANGTTLEEEVAKQARDIPLGRIAQPEEFARAAVFLLSPAASYLTGVMLPVDGGSYRATY
jgi:3-oxoacyl-[acyl-carrier protein] reductase